jgi:hypothetical protein
MTTLIASFAPPELPHPYVTAILGVFFLVSASLFWIFTFLFCANILAYIFFIVVAKTGLNEKSSTVGKLFRGFKLIRSKKFYISWIIAFIIYVVSYYLPKYLADYLGPTSPSIPFVE